MVRLANTDIVLARDLFHHRYHFGQEYRHLKKWTVAIIKTLSHLTVGQVVEATPKVIFESTQKFQIILDELFEVCDLVSEHPGKKRTTNHKLLPVKGFEGVSVSRSNQPRIVQKFLFLQFESVSRTNRLFSGVQVVFDATKAPNSGVECSLERVFVSFSSVTHRLVVTVCRLAIRRPHLHNGNDAGCQSENAAYQPLEVVKPASNRWLALSHNGLRQKLCRAVYHRWFARNGDVNQAVNYANRNSYDDSCLDLPPTTFTYQLKPPPVVSGKQSSTSGKELHFLGWLKSEPAGLRA